MKFSREELAMAVDEAKWMWLRGHLERGGLIVVAPELTLPDVGLKIAADDMVAIQAWVEAGKLAKPTAEQIAAWDADEEKKFMMLIISPYILIQE